MENHIDAGRRGESLALDYLLHLGYRLRHRNFRLFIGGQIVSLVGTWMQNVLLGAWGYTLTHSAGYVGLLYFAQLGPLLLLSVLGGVLADTLDRSPELAQAVAAGDVSPATATVLADVIARSRRAQRVGFVWRGFP